MSAGLPTDSAERKVIPICTGCIDYAPAAIEVLRDHLIGDYECVENNCGDAAVYLAQREYVALAAACLDLLVLDLTNEEAQTEDDDMMRRWGLALAEVAKVSKAGNDKHNPGQPMHHARWKSTDHEDCIARHLVDLAREPGGRDGGMLHSGCLAWRALMLLQRELERQGAPLARAARLHPDPAPVDLGEETAPV